MSEGWFVLFGALIGATFSTLTTYLTERYRNMNSLNIKLREKREELYFKILDALYSCLDSHIDNGRLDLDSLFEFFLSKRGEVVLYASHKIAFKFTGLLEYVGELQDAGIPANSEQHISIIKNKMLLLINSIRNDFQVDKKEYFTEDL